MFTTQENGDYAFSNARENIWGTIDCDVTLEETGEVIEFTATPDDAEEYGRVLYEQLSTTYASQVEAMSDAQRELEWAEIQRRERAARLKTTDWTQNPDVPEATRTLWQPYRQALRDISTQEGFPLTVNWPTPPA